MIDHEKAYLIGLFVGGGTITNDTFFIRLPFKKWGTDERNMNRIAVDILSKICMKFQHCFDFPVTYEIGNSEWLILPIGNVDLSILIDALKTLGLPTDGFLLNTVDLVKAKNELKGIAIESFLTGIFDTRASLTLSHRRFTEGAPVVSVEVPGSTENFKFVVQFCSWLTELGSVTDQILYNHPNQHSASDPHYKGWKKGFKIRFLVKSFIAKHSFALQAKAIDVENIEKMQVKDEQKPCIKRKIRKPSPVCIHSEINSKTLPPEVRNKIFLHYFHFCAQFGCPYVPIDELKKIVDDYRNLIFFLPRLEKGEVMDMRLRYDALCQAYFPDLKTQCDVLNVRDVIESPKYFEYHEFEQAIAFLFSPTLNGKRHVGGMNEIIQNAKDQFIKIEAPIGTSGYPILLTNSKNNRSAIISALHGFLNQMLIRKHIKRNNIEINII